MASGGGTPRAPTWAFPWQYAWPPHMGDHGGSWGLMGAHRGSGGIMGGKPFRASRQWPLRRSLAHFDDSGFGRSALSSWSIGGHSPLLQRSQNFLLLTAAVELVPLASCAPSPPQAASVTTAARSIPV